jgi:hypothetical protein
MNRHWAPRYTVLKTLMMRPIIAIISLDIGPNTSEYPSTLAQDFSLDFYSVRRMCRLCRHSPRLLPHPQVDAQGRTVSPNSEERWRVLLARRQMLCGLWAPRDGRQRDQGPSGNRAAPLNPKRSHVTESLRVGRYAAPRWAFWMTWVFGQRSLGDVYEQNICFALSTSER